VAIWAISRTECRTSCKGYGHKRISISQLYKWFKATFGWANRWYREFYPETRQRTIRNTPIIAHLHIGYRKRYLHDEEERTTQIDGYRKRYSGNRREPLRVLGIENDTCVMEGKEAGSGWWVSKTIPGENGRYLRNQVDILSQHGYRKRYPTIRSI